MCIYIYIYIMYTWLSMTSHIHSLKGLRCPISFSSLTEWTDLAIIPPTTISKETRTLKV